MSLPNKSKVCSICKKRGYTEWHHIISQHHARRTGQDDLITNPDNVIELCKNCHDQTTASMVRKRLTREGKPMRKSKRKRTVQPLFTKTAKPAKERKLVENVQRLEESMTNMELRGVFQRNPPRLGRLRLRGYLDAVKSEDEIAEKWAQYFSSGKSLQHLYPEDHWMHVPDQFDQESSREFEEDGFIWLENSQAWIADLSPEKANFNIKLAQVRAQQRQLVEQLQNVASREQEQRRLKDLHDKSIELLLERGVYDANSPVSQFNQLSTYLQQVSVFDEMAKKWSEFFSPLGQSGLQVLYPVDHWLHNEEKFDSKKSTEFEEDGFCWTANGVAWKHNFSMKQAQLEVQIAQIRSQEQNLIEQEENREKRVAELEKEQDRIETCIKSMSDRGCFDSQSPVKNTQNLVSYLEGIKTDSEIALRWSEFFTENKSNAFQMLFPKDHWLHSPENFNSKLSKNFEEDGFCWTPNGGAWKLGLTLEVAKAEVQLAQAKLR